MVMKWGEYTAVKPFVEWLNLTFFKIVDPCGFQADESSRSRRYSDECAGRDIQKVVSQPLHASCGSLLWWNIPDLPSFWRSWVPLDTFTVHFCHQLKYLHLLHLVFLAFALNYPISGVSLTSWELNLNHFTFMSHKACRRTHSHCNVSSVLIKYYMEDTMN